MLLEVVLLCLAAASLIYGFSTWTNSHWKKRGVPYVEPVPLFGNYWDLLTLRKSIRELNISIYEKGAGSPVIGFYQFCTPMLLLRDPELIKTVLVKDFSSFHDNSFVIHEDLDPLSARNPFFLKGEKWKAVRSLLTPAFTIGKIKPQIALMAPVSKDLVDHLEKEVPKSRPDGLEVRELAAKFTTDVVSTCAFGIAGNSLKDPNAEIRKMGSNLMKSSLWNYVKTTLITMMPALTKILRVQFMSDEVANFFRRIIKDTVSYREQNKVVRNDYLQMLLQIKSKGRVDDDSNSIRVGNVNLEYTEEDITAHAITFFVDGFETSSIVLGFAIYELALNPEIQDRLRQEVDTVLKKHNGEVCYEAIQDMVYLDMVLNETLRLHPPAAFTNRVCTKPYEMILPTGKSIHLEKGAAVVIPVEPLQKDPEHFPDPEKFDPERFSEDRKSNIKKSTLLTFGDGPRQCLGMRFALTQMKVALITIVSHFDIHKTPKTPIPLVIDDHAFLTLAKGGLWLDFVRRPTA